MKILIYWEQESWGGVDLHLLELLRTWPIKNDSFLLLYNKGNNGLNRIKVDLDHIENLKLKEIRSLSYNQLLSVIVRNKYFSWIRFLLYFFQPIIFLLNVIQLSLVFKKFSDGIDIFLSNNGGYPAAWGNLAALFSAKFVGIKSRILLVHHAATHYSLFIGLFERLIDRLLINYVSMIVCVSNATKKTIIDRRNINDEKVRFRVIHNTVSIDKSPHMKYGLESVNLKGTLRISQEILIGIVGRIEPYKGQEDVILAFGKLTPAERNFFKLAIIGKGETQEIARLRRLVDQLNLSNNIFFLGYLPGSSISIISELDLLISATISFEGFGLTLAEAICSKTPILATKVGAVVEYIDDQIGFLINPGSPDEIKDAILDFRMNKSDWVSKAEVAYKKFSSKKPMAVSFHEIFLECTSLVN